MTMCYVHPTDQHKREAIEKLEAYTRKKLFNIAEDAGYQQKALQ